MDVWRRRVLALVLNIFSPVHLLNCVQLFATPWTAACQASLSITNSQTHPVISFSSCLQSLTASGSFPVSHFFASVGQSIGASASASVLPMNIQDWFLLELTGLISLKSKGLSRVFKSINSLVFSFLYSSTPTSYMTNGKTIALTRWTFAGKVMSLLFNMLSGWSSEKAMAPHSSTLAWKIHGQRSLVGCSPWGR